MMKEIIEKIMNNPEWLARYKALAPNDAAGLAQLARDAGFNVTEQKIASEIANAPVGCSDEALEHVSGGHEVPRPGNVFY